MFMGVRAHPSLPPKAMCSFHMSQVSIQDLLSGQAQKHALRWARDFLEKHKGNPEVPIDQLRAHVEEADAAVRFATTPFKKYQAETLEKDIQLLAEHGDLIPTSLKYALLERQCEHFITALDMHGLVMMLCPWTASFDDDKGDKFRPREPRLVHIEGSPRDRSDYFRKKVIAFWCHAVRRGKPGAEATRKSAQVIVDFIANNDIPENDEGEDDESFDDAVDSILVAAKALLFLDLVGTDGLPASHIAQITMVDQVLGAGDLRGKRALENHFVMLCKELSSEPTYFQPKVKFYNSYKPALKKHLPAIEDAMAMLKRLPDTASTEVITESLLPLLEGLYLSVSTELPIEMYQGFEDCLADSITKYANTVVGRLCDNPDLEDGEEGLHTAASKLLTVAARTLPRSTTGWAALQVRLASFKDVAKSKSARERFEKAVAAAKTEDGAMVEGGAFAEIGLAWEGFRESSPEAKALAKQFAVKGKAVIEDMHTTLNDSAEDALESQYHVVKQMMDAFDVGEDDDLTKDFNQLAAAYRLAKKRLDFEALTGDNLEAKAAHDNDQMVIKAWRSAFVRAESVKGKGMTSADRSFLTKELKTSRCALDEASQIFLGAIGGEIARLVDECSAMCKEAKWPMDSDAAKGEWKDFKKAASKTWLGYVRGDVLNTKGEELKKALGDYDKFSGIFSSKAADDESVQKGREVVVAIDALVWSVRQYTKINEEGMTGIKLSRCAKRIQTQMNADPKPDIFHHIPEALRARIDAVVTCGPGASVDS